MNTREAIIDKALVTFADDGYEGASLSKIAEQVGIKKPSLYNHFDGKRELFITVFDKVITDYTRFMQKSYDVMTDQKTESVLRHILFETCDYYVENQHEAVFWKRALLFPNKEWKADIKEAFYSSEKTTNRIIEDIFHKGQSSRVVIAISVSELIQAYYCLLDGLFLQMSYYPKEEFEQRRENVWNIFWKGITLRSDA